MLPVIAIVGRPNVGKSTFFNRLTRSQDALVADQPGVTRDRLYGEADWNGRSVIVVDTGGMEGEKAGISAHVEQQAWQAVDEADVILFVVDGRAGLTAADISITEQLRKINKPTYLIINKAEHLDPNIVATDFYRLGFSHMIPISAAHGHGLEQLFSIVTLPPLVEEQAHEANKGIKLAIVGRPNVGKSTLVNRMLGEERVLVYDLPGTTRDSIYIPFTRQEQNYTLIDTAGVRRQRGITEAVEKFSVIKTLQAIADADVVILVVDGSENLTDQDMHLLGFIVDAGRALVIAVNKWDGLPVSQRQHIKNEFDRRLDFVKFARQHYISALHGTGVGELFASVKEAYAAATRELATPELTRILEGAVADHQPPAVQGRHIKLRYAHAGGQRPPVIVIHGKQTEHLPMSYKRYLANYFRKALRLVGTPIRIVLKSDENPYKGKRNLLTPRQQRKRERLLKYFKKKR